MVHIILGLYLDQATHTIVLTDDFGNTVKTFLGEHYIVTDTDYKDAEPAPKLF